MTQWVFISFTVFYFLAFSVHSREGAGIGGLAADGPHAHADVPHACAKSAERVDDEGVLRRSMWGLGRFQDGRCGCRYPDLTCWSGGNLRTAGWLGLGALSVVNGVWSRVCRSPPPPPCNEQRWGVSRGSCTMVLPSLFTAVSFHIGIAEFSNGPVS